MIGGGWSSEVVNIVIIYLFVVLSIYILDPVAAWMLLWCEGSCVTEHRIRKQSRDAHMTIVMLVYALCSIINHASHKQYSLVQQLSRLCSYSSWGGAWAGFEEWASFWRNAEPAFKGKSILFASADIWPIFVDLFLNNCLLAELSKGKECCGQRQIYLDETGYGSASEGVHAPLHVIAHPISHHNNESVLQRGDNANDIWDHIFKPTFHSIISSWSMG